jgi:diguanylate cyclase
MAAWCAQDVSGAIDAIHVNVSPRQLRQRGFAESVDRALRDAGLPPGRLRLEVTEQALVDDFREGAASLTALRRLGVRLALDDFGAGASSLCHLSELDADLLKLDRAFVRRLDVDLGARAVVRAVTALAHALGMRVTAEGIETPEQADGARAAGCDWLQGYLSGAPRPAGEMQVFFDTSLASDGSHLNDDGRTGLPSREGGPTHTLAAILGLVGTGDLAITPDTGPQDN